MPVTFNNPDFDKAKSLFEFSVYDLNKEVVKLDKYKGKVCVVVNTATKSLFTGPYYKAFNKLMNKYESQGLRILAFPCNQFNQEEPLSCEEIAQHAKEHDVKFDLFYKVNVNCYDASSVFKFLKHSLSDKYGSVIKGSYTKFIVDSKGVPRERFPPQVNPIDMEDVIKELLI